MDRTTEGILFAQGLVTSGIVAALAYDPVADPHLVILVAAHVAVLPLAFWHVTTVVNSSTWRPPVGFLGYAGLLGAYGYAAWALRDTPFRWAGYFLGVVAVGVVGLFVWALWSTWKQGHGGRSAGGPEGVVENGADGGGDRGSAG